MNSHRIKLRAALLVASVEFVAVALYHSACAKDTLPADLNDSQIAHVEYAKEQPGITRRPSGALYAKKPRELQIPRCMARHI